MRALPTIAFLLAGLLVAGGLSARAAAERSSHLTIQEPEADQEEESEARDPEEIRIELAAAERQHQLAFARNRLARLEADIEQEAALLERAKAGAALNAFETHEQAARIAESELSLQFEKDGAEDARDEMEQLAALYGQGDLAEKTAELVIRRAERGLERAQESLRLQEADHRQLVNVSLPRELFELRQAALAADFGIRKLDAQKELSQLEFADEIAQVEAEIAQLKAELAKTAAKPASGK
jgi:hypothetical protein